MIKFTRAESNLDEKTVIYKGKRYNPKGEEIIYTDDGAIFNGKMYKMSKKDMEWHQRDRRKNPTNHPAAGLRNLATEIVDID